MFGGSAPAVETSRSSMGSQTERTQAEGGRGEEGDRSGAGLLPEEEKEMKE